MSSNSVKCLDCNDGLKLTAENPTCHACGRIWSAEGSLFETSAEALSASMDEAFEGIVREPTKTSDQATSLAWWYVENGRRVGPVSIEVLQDAVQAMPEPHNVLIWNEGFTTWRRFGEVDELQTGKEEPSVALSPDVEHEPTVVADEVEAAGSAEGISELPEIGEEVLSPEGEPIEDWKPQAASSLRDITPLEPSPIEEDTWDDDGDDVGLPPSVDTAEFKREELFAHADRSSSTSPMTMIGVVAALVLGAFVVGQQFWELSGSASTPPGPVITSGDKESTVSDSTTEPESGEALDVATALPPTSIQATAPVDERKDAKPKTPAKKKRRLKKAKKLPNTVTDDVLARQLKKNSVSLAPCIEGAVAAKELPAGRHVITLAYDILPNGRVGSASLVGPAYLQGGALSRCVESTLASWRYPKTAKGREVRGQELAFRARAP